MERMWKAVRIAALGVALFTAACTSQHTDATGPVQTQSVTIKSFSFNPGSITVPVGSTITWTNQDAVAHTVTGAGFDSGPMAQNATFSHTFTTRGTFGYHCIFHSSMVALVTVQ